MRQNIAEIEGPVSRTGIYSLGDGMSLSELINKADGLLGDAYMERADIIRSNIDKTETYINVN